MEEKTTAKNSPFSVLPPAAQAAIPSPLRMRLYYLLLSVHRPGRGQMRGLCPFRWRRRRSPFTGDRVDDVDATIFVGESDGRLTSRARGVLERCMRIRRVNVFIEIVNSVVLLYPVGYVGLSVVGHGRRWISKA